jgi:NADPH:quinone reductase-like Zn-dependent oxidoreductase
VGTLVIAGGEGTGRLLAGADRQLRALVLSPFVRQRLKPLTSSPQWRDLEQLAQLIEAGQVIPVIDSTYVLDDAAEAMRRLVAGAARGKLAISIRPDNPTRKRLSETTARPSMVGTVMS